MARGRKPKQKRKMKRANGTGSVYKLSGNRRKPYVALLPGVVQFDKNTLKSTITKQVLGTFETEDAANKALDKYLENPYDIHKSKTFAEIYKMWSERYYATLSNESSARSYISAYNYSTALYNCKINEISITQMRDTIHSADVGPATKGRMKSLYNMMFDFAVESRYVNINLARQFTINNIYDAIKKENKSKIPISESHETALFECLDYGYVRMVLIGIYTGFRPHELCILERKNIHLEENYIIGGEKSEAGENRYVPIHPKIKPLIEYYYNLSKEKQFLINDEEGHHMTYDKYRGRFKKVMNFINANGLYSPHCTRHTFITKAKNAKLEDAALKLIVGHEINDITECVYTHRDNQKYLQEEILKIK